MSLLKLLVCAYLVWSLVRLVMLWDGFKCDHSTKVWLLVHQLLSLLLAVGHELAWLMCFTAPIVRNDSVGLAHGSLVQLPLNGNRKQKVISYSLLFLVVPAFVASDSLGLYLFFGCTVCVTSTCWPPDIVNQPQVVRMVLVVGCFFGMFYATFAMSVLCKLCNLLRPGRRRAAMIASAHIERQRVPRPGLNSRTGPTLIVPLQTLLEHCPEARCDKDAKLACSICQDECSDGQPIRTVVVCGHQYHSECLESWLQHRPTCPLCNQDVTTPVV